jgi:hypothetical protein
MHGVIVALVTRVLEAVAGATTAVQLGTTNEVEFV